jgi:hypothetical protein
MRVGFSHHARVATLTMILFGGGQARAQIWKHFIPTNQHSGSGAARDSGNTAHTVDDIENTSPASAGGLALTEQSGPWLIMAASFSGNGAEKQAHELAQELREQYHLRSYVHEMEFKFGDDASTGQSGYGSATRRRLRRGNEVREIAVLIGDFPSLDGPDAQQVLSRVKTLQPKALNVDASQTAQTMAEARRIEDAVLEKRGKSRKRGPMGQAFFTRNPLLPPEYFVPKGVDAFVAKMNEGVKHSLLDCPGRQTIQVATFRGKTILRTSAQEDASTKSFFGLRKRDDSNPLVEAAENAHLLTEALRSHGYEAYEFHNRTESIVTIGSFASATQSLPDGRVVAIPEVQRIVQTFDAGFDTPADPLSPIGNDSQNMHLVEEQQQQLRMKFSNQQAQLVAGLNPKHVKILRGHGKNVKVDRIIPMDVHPQVIDAPKRSISSAYTG